MDAAMWLFNIVTHCSIFLLLLATSQLWYCLMDSVTIVKEKRARACIPLVGSVMRSVCQGVAAIVKPPAVFISKELVKFGHATMNLVRRWIWTAVWRHTSLLMFMTFMHDEVWLPFLLSMVSVVIMIGLIYLPKDTGSSYIPKQHRRWASYRADLYKTMQQQVMRSSLVSHLEEFMYTKCRRVRLQSSMCGEVHKKIGVPVRHVVKRVSKTILMTWRWFIRSMDQSQYGASGVLGQAASRVLTTGSRVRAMMIIVVLCVFAGVLCAYQKQMKRKSRMIKSIINEIAVARILPSMAMSMHVIAGAYEIVCNNMSTVSRVTSCYLEWMGIVDNCCSKQQSSILVTACVFAIACCLVLLQDYWSNDDLEGPYDASDHAPHRDGDDCAPSKCSEEDNDCFYECDQYSVSDITFMPATTSSSAGRDRKGQSDLGLDSDSYWMAVDNCCTSCISNCLADFIGPMTKVVARMKGIGGVQIVASMKGTLRWRISDDDGRVHTFMIKDSFYHKSSPYRLLSPQHLAQTCYDDARGTWCGTYRDGIDLHWDHNRFKRSIPLNRANIALMRSAPGYDTFDVFASAFEEIDEGVSWTCMPTTVSDDENESDDNDDDDNDPDETRGEIVEVTRRHPDIPDSVFPDREANLGAKEKMSPDDEWLRFVDEDGANQTVHIIPEDEEVQLKTTQADFLAWHYRLGHISFEKIRQMAARGDLPAAFRDCRVPKCAALHCAIRYE
jgi:hypothetical protein